MFSTALMNVVCLVNVFLPFLGKWQELQVVVSTLGDDSSL